MLNKTRIGIPTLTKTNLNIPTLIEIWTSYPEVLRSVFIVQGEKGIVFLVNRKELGLLGSKYQKYNSVQREGKQKTNT